jgi:hypothetical protein
MCGSPDDYDSWRNPLACNKTNIILYLICHARTNDISHYPISRAAVTESDRKSSPLMVFI